MLMLATLIACKHEMKLQVVADNMSPTIKKGDIIRVIECDVNDIKVGDIIVFYELINGKENSTRIELLK